MRALFFVLVLVFSMVSCSDDSIGNRKEFLEANNLPDSSYFPETFNDPRWKHLAGDYFYLITDARVGSSTANMFVLGNKKANELVAFLSLNLFLIQGRQGEGQYKNRFIVPYEKVTQGDYDYGNDLSGFNAILKSMPELKGFSWKNELQNRMMSGLIMYTQLRGISSKSSPEVLMDSTLSKEQKLKKIMEGAYEYNVRNFLRYTPSTDLYQEIKRKGFQMNPMVVSPFEKDKAYAEVLKGEFDFDDKSCLYIYYPFTSYEYIQTQPGEEPLLVYFPAVHILQFKLSFTNDKYPQLQKKGLYLSLMDGKVKRFKD